MYSIWKVHAIVAYVMYSIGKILIKVPILTIVNMAVEMLTHLKHSYLCHNINNGIRVKRSLYDRLEVKTKIPF